MIPREHASFLRRLCSATPMPVSSTAAVANLSAFWYAASATASTTRRVRSRSKAANAVAAHRARSSIIRARGAPGGSAGTASTTLMDGPPRPRQKSRDRRLARRAGNVAQRLADGDRGAVEDLVHQVGPEQDPRLELEHPRIEGREDRPDAVLVEPAHDELGALRVVELEPHHDPVLADAHEPLGIGLLDRAQARAEALGDVMDHRAHLRPPADLEHLQRHDAPELGAPAGRDVAEAVLLEPGRALLGDDRAGDRVHASGDPLADDHDVRLDPGLRHAPHLAGPHQARLHLVGDVERAVALA